MSDSPLRGFAVALEMAGTDSVQALLRRFEDVGIMWTSHRDASVRFTNSAVADIEFRQWLQEAAVGEPRRGTSVRRDLPPYGSDPLGDEVRELRAKLSRLESWVEMALETGKVPKYDPRT